MSIEKYYYTKNVDAEILEEAINLRTSVRSEFVGCHVTKNGDGSVPTDNIELEFNRALTSSEQDEITAIINSYGPAYDLVVRKGLEKNTMNWAMEEGHKILRQFAANNIYRGKSAAQVKALITDYPAMINSLVTGSLQTALAEFASTTPDANISQDEIDEFVLRLQITLGL